MRFARSFVIGALLVGASAGSVVLLAGCDDASNKTGAQATASPDAKKAEDSMRNFMQQKSEPAKK